MIDHYNTNPIEDLFKIYDWKIFKKEQKNKYFDIYSINKIHSKFKITKK